LYLALAGPGELPDKYLSPEQQLLLFQMESCAMSDHQLRFKGPGFDFDAKGWVAILAAIVIVAIVVVVVKLI
jgi:hypothetical protein